MLKIKLLFAVFTFAFYSCRTGCDSIPDHFSGYEEAKQFVRSASFKISEELPIEGGKQVKSFEFYSCNNSSGFLIMNTTDKDYIYDNIPVSEWDRLKEADNPLGYYRDNIKGQGGFSRYQP